MNYLSIDRSKHKDRYRAIRVGANEHMDYLRKTERKVLLPKIGIENTSGLLIIGMRKGLTKEQKSKLEREKFTHKDYEVKTFDDILLQNQQVIANLRNYYRSIDQWFVENWAGMEQQDLDLLSDAVWRSNGDTQFRIRLQSALQQIHERFFFIGVRPYIFKIDKTGGKWI